MSGALGREERQAGLRAGLTGGAQARQPSNAGTGSPGVPNAPGVNLRGASMMAAQSDAAVARVLDTSERIMTESLAAQAAERGAEQARVEPLELRRGADGTIEMPDLTPGFLETTSQRARRAVLRDRYANELITGTQEQLQRRRTEAAGSPETFQRLAGADRDGMMRALPEGVRAVVGQRMDQLILGHVESMSAERVRQERDAARQALGVALNGDRRDANDLVAAGQDGSVARERGIARVAASRAAGTITQAEADQQTRQLTVLDPVQASLRRELGRLDPTAATARLLLLSSGNPSQPGWNAAWDALSGEERQAIAQAEGSAVRTRRQITEWGRADSDRAAGLALGDAVKRFSDLFERAEPGAPLTVADIGRASAILDEVRRLDRSGGLYATLSRRFNAEQQQAGNEAMRDRLVATTRAALDAAAAGEGPTSQVAAQIIRDTQIMADGLPLPQQAQLWERAGNLYAQQAQTLRPMIQREANYTEALAGTRRVENNADNQALQEQSLRRAGVTTLMEPEAPAAVAREARTGALTPRVLQLMRSAVESGNPAAFRQAGLVHEALMRDPEARSVYVRAVPDEIRGALSGVAMTLEGAPDDGNVIQTAVALARRRMQGDGGAAEALMARLGATQAEQAVSADKLMREGIEARPEFSGWIGRQLGGQGAPTHIPPALRNQWMTHLAVTAQHYSTLEGAATAATERLLSGWQPSQLSLPDPSMDAAGLAAGQSGAAWVRVPRRGQIPDQMTAPWRTNAPGVEWQTPWVRSQLREMGMSERDANRVTVGDTARWRLADQPGEGGRPVWNLWVRQETGAFMPVMERVAGQETMRPAPFDIAKAREARLQDFRSNQIEGAARALEEMRANPGSAGGLMPDASVPDSGVRRPDPRPGSQMMPEIPQ